MALSKASLNSPESYCKLVCFLSRTLTPGHFIEVQVQVLQMWADPIIARAHISRETIHYSKLAFLCFVHLMPDEMLKQKQKLMDQIARGLPNHFNSTDYRTVKLARMICELMNETFIFHEKNPEKEAKFDASDFINDRFCMELLSQFSLCCSLTEKFWLREKIESLTHHPSTQKATKSGDSNSKTISSEEKVEPVDSDDDDDDDLEPIESIEAPSKVKLTYVRDYLDGEFKTYDEMESALKALPNVLQHQLKLEHVQVAKDILDSVFRWENEYDVAVLDAYRHKSLCAILKTPDRPAVVDQFCRYFHAQQMQPYKKNLIFSVLSEVSKEVPLKQLVPIAKSAFNIILADEGVIQRQDGSVKVPMILFFGQMLVNTLPKQLVEEEMVVSYLKCLNQLAEVDGAVVQCVQYAVHNLSEVLEHLQHVTSRGLAPTADQSLEASISDTKRWLCQLQNARVDSL